MIPNDINERRKMIKFMLEALETEDEMSKWESDFTASIADQFTIKKDLSQRQCEKLEQIYDKYN